MDILSHIPGNYGLPVVGNTFKHLRDPVGFKHQMRARYGDVYKNSVLFRKTVVLLGEAANREVLLNRNGEFSSELGWGQFIGKLFPRGLMLLDGEDHRRIRQLMGPDFTRMANSGYEERIRHRVTSAISRMGESITDAYAFSKDLTLQAALDSFFSFSADDNSRKMVLDDLMQIVAGSFSLVRYPVPGTRFGAALRARGRLIESLRKHSKRLLEMPAEKSLFSRLVHEAGRNAGEIEHEDVISQMLFLVMASHDTTASAITSTLFFLAANPMWQEMLADELSATEEENMESFPMLGAVIKESVRLHPPVPELPRTTLRDVEICGFRIPKNVRIGISPVFTHRIPEYWDSPTTFNPERFLGGNYDAGLYKYRYIPFGGGVHHCLGHLFGSSELRIVVSELIRGYQIALPSLKEAVQFSMFPFPHPTRALGLLLKKR